MHQSEYHKAWKDIVMSFVKQTSTKARVFRLGDNVGLTPLAARTSSGVLLETEEKERRIKF